MRVPIIHNEPTRVSAGPWGSLLDLLSVQGAAEKKYPLKIFGNISATTEHFSIKFYAPFVCSYLCKITKFYSIITYSDTVVSY